MIARTPKPERTLRQYVETYILEHGLNPRRVRSYRAAVSRLDQFAGEPVKLDALNDDLLARWIEAAATTGTFSAATLRDWRCRVMQLWCAAHEAGLAPASSRTVKTWIAPATGALTLRTLCKRHPRIVKASARKNLITVINRFEKFLDRSAETTDLTADNWNRFRAWLRRTYDKNKTREDSVWALRALWAFAHSKGLVPDVPTKASACRRAEYRALDDAPASSGPPENLHRFFLDVYLPLKLRGRSPITSRHYRIAIGKFDKFLGRFATFADLTDETVSALGAWVVEQGRTSATANQCLSHILSLWRFAARKRFVEQFPDVPKLIEPVRIPKAWLEAELAKLWKASAAELGDIAGIPAGLWWVALHEVMWWSGERIGALLQVRWSDIDLETGWLIVRAECRKFQTADQARALPECAREALEAIAKPERELLFPWPKSPGFLWKKYTSILKRAGLPHDRKSKFHRMRRSAASHFERAGGNATDLLGHSTRRVTRGYLDPRIATPPQAKDFLFNPGGPKEDDSEPKGGAA